MDSAFQAERDRLDRVREGLEQTEAFLELRGTRSRLQRLPVEKLRVTGDIDRARTQGDEDKLAQALARITELENERDRLQATVDRLERENGIDPLTGVASRRRLDQTLDVEWRRMKRIRGTIGVVFIDLDNFKKINDDHDHRLGDIVLQGVGEQLQRSVRRAGELATRYGGDEFVVIVPDASLEETAGLAAHIAEGLRKMEIRAGDLSVRITASIGVAVANPYSDRIQPHDLVIRADQAAIMAKQNGKDRVIAAVLQADSGELAFAAVRAPAAPAAGAVNTQNNRRATGARR
jgi:diguanylate cyclase (GGDEF)-like protein